MDYEPEKMTVEAMASLINSAYNDITFKNALVCTLDWCNHQHSVNIHKNTKIAVDRNGYRIEKYSSVATSKKYKKTNDTSPVEGKDYFSKNSSGKYVKVTPQSGDNPKSKGWYEYENPVENNWYEKITVKSTYVEIPKKDYSYYNNPRYEKWYELVNGVYSPSLDNHAMGNGPDDYVPRAVTPSDNPRDLGLYEPYDVWPGYIPTSDTEPVEGFTYYECHYKQYYRRIDEYCEEYVASEDTVVDPDKSYFIIKQADRYLPSPEDEEEWYKNRYSRHVDISIPGIESEITLEKKRPAQLGG